MTEGTNRGKCVYTQFRPNKPLTEKVIVTNKSELMKLGEFVPVEANSLNHNRLLNDEMLNSIILSIKPSYSDLILSGEKIYEFRNFKPKNFTSYFWIYESVPSKELKCILKIKTL